MIQTRKVTPRVLLLRMVCTCVVVGGLAPSVGCTDSRVEETMVYQREDDRRVMGDVGGSIDDSPIRVEVTETTSTSGGWVLEKRQLGAVWLRSKDVVHVYGAGGEGIGSFRPDDHTVVHVDSSGGAIVNSSSDRDRQFLYTGLALFGPLLQHQFEDRAADRREDGLLLFDYIDDGGNNAEYAVYEDSGIPARYCSTTVGSRRCVEWSVDRIEELSVQDAESAVQWRKRADLSNVSYKHYVYGDEVTAITGIDVYGFDEAVLPAGSRVDTTVLIGDMDGEDKRRWIGAEVMYGGLSPLALMEQSRFTVQTRNDPSVCIDSPQWHMFSSTQSAKVIDGKCVMLLAGTVEVSEEMREGVRIINRSGVDQ